MDSPLNEVSYQKWYVTYCAFSDRTLTIQLGRLLTTGGSKNPRAYTVIFRDVIYFEQFQEFYWPEEFFKGRSDGVLGHHESSEVLDRRATIELDKTPREYRHFSLLTSDACFSVLTSYEPTIVRNDDSI